MPLLAPVIRMTLGSVDGIAIFHTPVVGSKLAAPVTDSSEDDVAGVRPVEALCVHRPVNEW
jgi:hypothetical protein